MAELLNYADVYKTLGEYLADPGGASVPPLMDRYLHGECDLLAMALHQLLGWPIYALMEERELLDGLEFKVAGLAHAFVSPDGGVTGVDVRGVRKYEEIYSEFNDITGDCGPPWLELFIEEGQLTFGDDLDRKETSDAARYDDAICVAVALTDLLKLR